MDDVVPGVLQRLRAADIIHMAGLAAASLGQEYCRIGAVHETMRRGAQLLGVVDTSHAVAEIAESSTNSALVTEHVLSEAHRYVVDVELLSSTGCLMHCTCRPIGGSAICQHAAALLYQWLATPSAFGSSAPQDSHMPSPLVEKEDKVTPAVAEPQTALKSARTSNKSGATGYVAMLRGPTPSAPLLDILTQMGIGELRGLAREYDVTPTGQSKQQLAEAILDVLQQPDVVRKVASGLEKPQRQLLATLTLAGGSITDDDLRSLFERFGLGSPEKLQQMLLTLQSKGLLFRTNLHSSPQQRIGLSGSLFDIGWSVPAEVRASLRVPIPVTPFHLAGEDGAEGERPTILHVEPYHLLSDLLLVARALDGFRLDTRTEKDEHKSISRSSYPPYVPTARVQRSPTQEDTANVTPLDELLSPALLATLQASVTRTPALLRYAVRLLRLADILHKDDSDSSYLRSLPNAARLLLGPTRAEVARDLFELWLTQPGYEELFELQEENLRLRCRTTPLNHPILRPGELEAENSEARQMLVALIAQAPLDQWISFSAFARFIYRLIPTFLQKRQRLFPAPHWWLEAEEGRPLQPTQMYDWMRAEGHYLARLLRGPLHWWGISDLALGNEGQLLAFRLTPLAALLLNGIEPDEPLTEREDEDIYSLLDVSEEGEIVISCAPAAWSLIELVEQFTEQVGVRDNRLCYRLVPQSLTVALSRGQDPTALLRLLEHVAERQAQRESPLTRLMGQLERWTTSYGQIRLYTGVSLLEVADVLVMRELNATTSVEEQIVQTLSPTRLLLNKQSIERIIEELKRRGQTPLLHEEDEYGTE
jgi:hypothetical protein